MAPNARSRVTSARTCIRHYSSLVALCVTGALILIGIYVVNATTVDYWHNAPHGRCEAAHEHKFLREPVNSVSNIVFVLAGIYCLLASRLDYRYSKHVGAQQLDHASLQLQMVPGSGYEDDATAGTDHVRPMVGLWRQPALSFVYGLAVFFAGAFSFYYHACAGCSLGGFLDVSSIFFLSHSVLCLLGYSLSMLWVVPATTAAGATAQETRDKWSGRVWILMWAIGMGVFSQWKDLIWLGSWQKMYYLLMGLVVFLGVMFIGLAVLLRKRRTPGLAKVFIPLAVACTLVGFGVWLPEEVMHKCLLPPDSALQLHGLWHAMLAFACWFLFIFMRSVNNHFLFFQEPAPTDADRKRRFWSFVLLVQPLARAFQDEVVDSDKVHIQYHAPL